MTEHRTPEQVMQRDIDAMGPELGPFFHSLSNEAVWVHAKWQEYREIFAHPERIELVNGVAGFFFRVVQDCLWDDVLLSIARLADGQKSVGQQNLSMAALPRYLPAGALRDEVEPLVADFRMKAEFARQHRHKRLAHNDLDTKLGAVPLTGISRALVEEMLVALARALNAVQGHYLDGEMMYDGFIATSGAESLVAVLSRYRRYRAERARPAQ